MSHSPRTGSNNAAGENAKGNGHVLVVDDDQSMCQMLEEALGRRGFPTVARTSAGASQHILIARFHPKRQEVASRFVHDGELVHRH